MKYCEKSIVSLFAAIAGLSSIAFPEDALAQSRSQPFQNFDSIQIRQRENVRVIPLITLPQAFDSAFYEHGGNYFDRTSIQGTGESLGGLFFPELEVADDAESVNALYRDAMNQQLYSDPFIRTPDLDVYQGSLLTLPYACGTSPVIVDGTALQCTRR
ncbi:hypothetical protein IQ235_07580 [Oscillatoriales cyanobacterium LEGE 11467]|uniref:Uncharacterized protein n=1 Tax=Zarconia navalis LEGE 11467 TaxID=1828826 RepID=A0A928VZQ5_9CYAN|nr:hypothetical protein [Zarconia navalis]MBE9040640.1 hypothetical protein [Zarconia navalis LEGE 11467]